MEKVVRGERCGESGERKNLVLKFLSCFPILF